MGKATLARQKAIGAIGIGRVMRLEDAGLIVLSSDDYERLKADLAECKRRIALFGVDWILHDDVGARMLEEAMAR